ncbi:MAG: thioredoxin family protein [Vampirovibrionia bacterium]
MKKIKVLGTGCPKCSKLFEQVKEAAESLNIEYEIEKVKDINKIMEYGVMITPALVVDDEVKVSGKVPSVEDLKNLL